jgi:hypothetical protein
MLMLVPGGLAVNIRIGRLVERAQSSAPSTVAALPPLLLLLELVKPQCLSRPSSSNAATVSAVPCGCGWPITSKPAVSLVPILAAGEFVYFAIAQWPGW